METTYICSGWMVNDSRHSLERAKERAGLNKKKAEKMIYLAKHRGITSKDCKWSADRKYLETKTSATTEAVAYNGYCFILDKVTMNCITMYALPKDFGKKKTRYAASNRATQREEQRAYQLEFAY